MTSNLFLGLVLAVLAWPSSTGSLAVSSGITTSRAITTSSAAAGIASSWETTLAVAVHNGMPFGTHIVFTYGPLGFLQDLQLNYWWTTAFSLVFSLSFFTAVFAALVGSLRRTIPLVVAVVVAYVVGAVTLRDWGYLITEVLALVLVVCVAVMSRADDRPAPRWIWAVLGGLLGIFSLVQVSLGLGIVAVLIVTVASLSGGRRQAVSTIVLGAVPTFCLGWFGTGNGFANIVPFAKGSAAIIGGYSSAMSLMDDGRAGADLLAALVVVFIGIVAFDHGRRLPGRSRIGIGLVTLVVVWLLLKEAFVRHDAHDLIFFAAAPLVLAAFAPRRWSWTLAPGMLVITGMFMILGHGVLPLAPRPDLAIPHFFDEAATIASPSRTATAIEQSRRSLRNTYALPNRMVAMMQDHTVDISPWEQNVAWAYPRIRFDPLPVIQDYSAYTPSLDQLDTSYLASSDAPHFILRQPKAAIDRRNPAFEPPATQLAIECRYHQVSGSASWQLLELGADRCGSLQPIRTVTTGYGHWVAVPTPPAGNAIVARFQLTQGWLPKLETIVFRPPSVFLWYNGSRQPWRFVTATATDPHVLRVASTLGYDTRFMPVSFTRLRFTMVGVTRSTKGVTVSFYRVRIAPVPAGSR